MRWIFLALVLALPTAAASDFGRPEPATFVEYEVPSGTAAEPTIGIPWNTDSVFYHATASTWRAKFDAAGEPTWTDVTAPYQVPTNLDPMLITDPDTNRIFAGGLHGACSVMMISDNDGETWTSSLNMCSGANFDHQSIGSGPPAGPIPAPDPTYTHIAYYCAQGGTISCTRSLDGGRAWGPFQDVPGPCGGFHGHIRVSPKTGFLGLPVAACGDKHGYISTADGGLTWQSNQIPGTEQWTNGFDPSLQFSRDSGWMYYAMASEHGIHVALSKDEGATWEPLGADHGKADAWLDVGALHDPPIVAGSFTNLQAGDDDRVALTFFGLEGGPGADLEFLKSNAIYRCDTRQDELVWRPYYAVSYDAGQNWTVARVTDDPVQIGGLYDVLVSGGGGCRNHLDFNDMDIDSTGRMYYGIVDGCVRTCATEQKAGGDGYRTAEARLWRQVTGRGLFAEYDLPGENGTTTPAPTPTPTSESEKVPNLGAGILIAAGSVAAFAYRRK